MTFPTNGSEEKPAQYGIENADGARLVAALLRGYPLLGLKHVHKRVQETLWFQIAKVVAGARNGNGADRLSRALAGIRIPGHDEKESRIQILGAIANQDEWVEAWLQNDKEFTGRKSIGRQRYEEVSDMYEGIEWLWEPWIPRGYLSMICGRPGIGKSMFLAYIVTAFLRGGKLPDGKEITQEVCPGKPEHSDTEPCGCPQVMWIDTEGTQPLLIQRFKMMRTPLRQVFYPTGGAPEEQDFPIIDLTQERWKGIVTNLAIYWRPTWIIIDSLRGSHTADETSSDRVQGILAWAAALARDLGAAFTFSHHLRKSAPGEPEGVTLDSVRGSTAIAAMMRTILALDRPDPHNESMRLHCIKSNLAKMPKACGLLLAEETGTPTLTAAPEPQRHESLTARAVNFLETRLRRGPKDTEELYYEAEQAGISRRTIRVAKDKMELVALHPDKNHKRWRWALKDIIKPWPDQKEDEPF